MKRHRCIYLYLGIFIAFAHDALSTSIITEWSPIVIDGTIKDTPQPTIGTRTLALVFTSAYDAWSAYDPIALGAVIGNTLDGTGGPSTIENMNEAISHAIYNALLAVAPTNKLQYDAFMASKGYDTTAMTAPAMLGQKVAQLVVASRANDGSNWQNKYADTTGYKVADPSVKDSWQPVAVPLDGTTTTLQKPLTPHWGGVTPFAIFDIGSLRLPPPAATGTPAFEAQVQQLLDFSANLTDEQKAIVEYWLPLKGTPPMLHGTHIEYVSNLKGFDLEKDAKIFFLVHNAMLDSSIHCWSNKFHYNYCRPITAIRGMGDKPIRAWGGPGKGAVDMLAKQWRPYQPAANPTPPFPEYSSGHSTFSGAFAEIMKLFTGSDEFGYSVTVDKLNFDERTLSTPITLHWETYTAAAEQAGISRLYGGIHFMDANLTGQEYGRKIGTLVYNKGQQLFNGVTSNVDTWDAYQ